MLYVSEDG